MGRARAHRDDLGVAVGKALRDRAPDPVALAAAGRQERLDVDASIPDHDHGVTREELDGTWRKRVAEVGLFDLVDRGRAQLHQGLAFQGGAGLLGGRRAGRGAERPMID